MSVELPWTFPSAADRLSAEGRRLRQLSTAERLEQVLGLIESGRELLRDAPLREEQRRHREQLEAAQRARWAELFAKYLAR